MTDIDGKNVLGEEGKSLAVLFDYQYGFFDRIAHEHFFQGATSTPTLELQIKMICRSNAVVKNLYIEVISNTFLGNISFGLRKNGNNQNNTISDIRTFNYGAGETGLKEATGETFDYLKDDFISLGFVEAEPNQTIRYRMGLTMEFDPI